MAEEASEQLKEKYVELSTLDKQIKQMQEQHEKFSMQIAELSGMIGSLDELKAVKQGSKALVPVFQGIFVNATIENTDEFIVNVGDNVAVKKNLEETKTLLTSQISELEKFSVQLSQNIEQMIDQAQNLQKEAMGIVK